jgi:peptidoglycan hydrolase CwlO-like protein|tara:strand:+ start:155 stop:406 length:252 start_codon:yes stop_codon:yes gene_type:complete
LEAELIGFKEENGFLNTDVAELSAKIELLDNEIEERKQVEEDLQVRVETMHENNKALEGRIEELEEQIRKNAKLLKRQSILDQ